ncbi:pilus assembly PilX family protein [Luteimonas sp. RIT-PG2_3]
MNLSSARRNEQGVSLLVVLVLLLVMTLLGVAVLRTTLLEERMTANLYDRSLSFQSAESALREGELVAATGPTPPASGCANGVCATPAAGSTERWLDTAFVTGWRAGTRSTEAQAALLPASSFIVEFMGLAPSWPGCDRMVPVPNLCMRPSYRITARSVQADRAPVILQSNYVMR